MRHTVSRSLNRSYGQRPLVRHDQVLAPASRTGGCSRPAGHGRRPPGRGSRRRRLVHDHQRLRNESRRHLGDRARQHVGRPARRVGHDQLDRFVRVVRGHRDCPSHQERQGQDACDPRSAFHVSPPFWNRPSFRCCSGDTGRSPFLFVTSARVAASSWPDEDAPGAFREPPSSARRPVGLWEAQPRARADADVNASCHRTASIPVRFWQTLSRIPLWPSTHARNSSHMPRSAAVPSGQTGHVYA